MMLSNDKKNYLRAFVYAFGISLLFFLPIVIYHKGYFFFLGDFNVQQIPFYRLAHDAVRSGQMGWNWYTDLGANFIGSYSFYLLGSPFFWLTIPFPGDVLPFLMAPLLCLKMALMSVTAFSYIKRFVKRQDFALIGALLYAFSGFSVYNIFYNHFHDVMVFFPLLLVSLEEAVINRRRLFFALMVALNAVVNYFFFAGQVVFVVVYFLVRFSYGSRNSPSFDNSTAAANEGWFVDIKTLVRLAFESVAGLALAAFMLLPSLMAIEGNTRIRPHPLGADFLFYSERQRIMSIVSSILFPPELPPYIAFFPEANIRWISLAAWLPLFSLIGVAAFIRYRKGHFFTPLIITCAVFACVPGLNSAFFMFRASYYARWFYMPVLIMAAMTAHALSTRRINLNPSIQKVFMATTLVVLVIGLFPTGNLDNRAYGLYNRNVAHVFWSNGAIALLSVILVWYVYNKYRHTSRTYVKKLFTMLFAICIIYPMLFLAYGQTDNTKSIVDYGLKARGNFVLPDASEDEFYRIDITGGNDNIGMFWNMPNIQAFHSIVPSSVMDFYPSVGVKRDVSSKPDTTHYGLRALLSVKYQFVRASSTTGEPESELPFFKYSSTQFGYHVFENELYLPMGFVYDTYCDEPTFYSLAEDKRELLLLNSILLSREQIEKYGSLMVQLPIEEMPELNRSSYEDDTKKRIANSCDSFVVQKNGFSAAITLADDNLVFFSVPHEQGFSAAVNGKSVPVENVSVGFMAVKGTKGSNVIEFTYETPGLARGIQISVIAALALILYVVLTSYFTNRHYNKQRRSVIDE